MNTQKNERYHETEQRLIQEFIILLEKKDLSKITVRELCDACGIHRSSFYLHFQDIYAMLETIEDYLARFYGELFTDEGTDLTHRFLQLFTFIRDHKSFYKVYWSRSHDLKVLEAAIPDDQNKNLSEAARRIGISDPTELQYHQLFFRSGLAAAIGFWLSRDCLETPEQMMLFLEKEYHGRIY